MAKHKLTHTYLKPLTSKIRNRQFATFDLETSTDLVCCYLAGFYDGETYRYFESPMLKPEEPNSAVDQFLTWLTSTGRTYKSHWLYAHNGGNFDFLYVLRWFLNRPDDYSLEITPVQSSILALTVRSKTDEQVKWSFVDSYKLMNAKLEDIATTFNLGGKVKNIDYETLHLDPRRYEYLETDVKILYNALSKFFGLIYDLGGDIGVTAPATSMLTFRRRFLSKDIPINRHFADCKARDDENHTCVGGCLHLFVRRGYYGGRVERLRAAFVARNSNDHLNVGDVNSMYPAAMLEPMPTEYVGARHGPIDIHKMSRFWLGFIECTVFVPHETYLPPLPYRTNSKLVFPTGVFSGVWSSVELLAAIEHGAQIQSYGTSVWFKGETIFDEYVHHLYKFRDKNSPSYDPSMALIAKLLLNSLYGKMGMRETREKLWFNPRRQEFIDHDLTPLEDLGHGIFTEAIAVNATYVIPHIAAWVTALARVKLFKLMQGFLAQGHKVYYCDTDSIFTTAPIESKAGLGELKLEKQWDWAKFVAPKLYAGGTYTADGTRTVETSLVKAKGFSGGFGGGQPDLKVFEELVEHRRKVSSKRMRKFREGLRSNERFPAMKTVEKGLTLDRWSIDEKRILLPNGDTKPLFVLEE